MSTHSSRPRPQQDVSQSKDLIQKKTPNLGWPQARHLPPPRFFPVLSAPRSPHRQLHHLPPPFSGDAPSLVSICGCPAPSTPHTKSPLDGPFLRAFSTDFTELFCLSPLNAGSSAPRGGTSCPLLRPLHLTGRSVPVRWMSPPAGYRGCIPRHLQHLKPAPNIPQSISS